MLVTAAFLAILSTAAIFLLIWRWRHFNYFNVLGIPGPKPNLIWGNIREYHSMEIYKVIGKWLDKYGDVFGFFNGDVPFVVIRDLDFIEDVFVRNFQNFVNRGITVMTDQMHPIMGQSILHVGGYKWKNIRTSVSLSLTSKKLKMMMQYIQEDTSVFVQRLKEYADTGKEVQMLHNFETTATALSYLIYALAKHQDVQEKVRKEVIDAVGTNGELDYETVTKKLKYMGSVVDETLRLYPPGLSFVTRQAKEDYVYNGILFKAGTCFMVPQYQVQRDPRYWPNPLEFKPERHSSDNEAALKKTAYTAFGVGPRQCVGTRLSLLEMRYVAGKMLQKYRLELGPSQKGTMELGQYAMVSTPANGPWILLRSLTNENIGR
ncbi:hypothetical protein HPB49_019140 [Dermacentor silvarum]|uniref:Uncharacterized protein n=1 Tax=Dermacentor silvarum TaxID=543639 RepID=A0ACB8CYV7_DERSI|nr:hypothetical protein HPB49_019140 [Dermacentor silvarum]